jgi:dCMP deaminase
VNPANSLDALIDQAPFYLRGALDFARQSSDPSTQNGAILVTPAYGRDGFPIAQGYNTLPTGVRDQSDRWLSPAKYKFVEHAERNAIYEAARLGFATHGAVMFCPWAACSDCARAIIQAGIKVLVRCPSSMPAEHWAEDILLGDLMMTEAGVRITEVGVTWEGFLRRNGEPWTP